MGACLLTRGKPQERQPPRHARVRALAQGLWHVRPEAVRQQIRQHWVVTGQQLQSNTERERETEGNGGGGDEPAQKKVTADMLRLRQDVQPLKGSRWKVHTR